MSEAIDSKAIFRPSEDAVVREIEGELIIVPLGSGIGEAGDDLYSLDPVGRAIWSRLDGKTNVGEIVASLAGEYEAAREEIERDTHGFLEELLRRNLVTRETGPAGRRPS